MDMFRSTVNMVCFAWRTTQGIFGMFDFSISGHVTLQNVVRGQGVKAYGRFAASLAMPLAGKVPRVVTPLVGVWTQSSWGMLSGRSFAAQCTRNEPRPCDRKSCAQPNFSKRQGKPARWAWHSHLNQVSSNRAAHNSVQAPDLPLHPQYSTVTPRVIHSCSFISCCLSCIQGRSDPFPGLAASLLDAYIASPKSLCFSVPHLHIFYPQAIIHIALIKRPDPTLLPKYTTRQ